MSIVYESENATGDIKGRGVKRKRKSSGVSMSDGKRDATSNCVWVGVLISSRRETVGGRDRCLVNGTMREGRVA